MELYRNEAKKSLEKEALNMYWENMSFITFLKILSSSFHLALMPKITSCFIVNHKNTAHPHIALFPGGIL